MKYNFYLIKILEIMSIQKQTVVSVEKINFLEKSFIEYLSRLTREEANTKAFEYITHTNYKWKGNSSLFNLKTTIKCIISVKN